MRVMAIIMTSMFLIVFLFSGAFAQDNPAGSPLGKSTKIMLAVEGNEYPAILHANAAARDFISRLPLAVSLSRGSRDYCGGIAPLKYDPQQVQNGYRNGELAYWVPGEDFVIFMEKEETGASVKGVVVLGELSGDFQSLFDLGNSVEVRVRLAN